jgi:hypothetical protein
MSISRRKILRFVPFLTVGFIPSAKAEEPKQESPGTVLGHQLHDEVSASLLNTYARSLALEDEEARWEAQMLFHEGQLARRSGGTRSHVLGYRHRNFVEAHEAQSLPVKKDL